MRPTKPPRPGLETNKQSLHQTQGDSVLTTETSPHQQTLYNLFNLETYAPKR